ncbi:MAG: cation:proton antiporter, partial [Clostridiales bacterium]|nr:cation:proton antiporter [Clostridiales bacterium]
NDQFQYMLTLLTLSAMTGGEAAKNLPLQIVSTLFSQLLFGLLIGGAIALAARWFLSHFTFDTSGFDAAFMLAVSLLAYALPCTVGGNGYLSAYMVGIILGNQPMRNKKALFNFFDGFTSLCQMMIFFMLGLLSYPSRIAASLIPALAIALFLTFVARPFAVALLLTPQKASLHQQLLISWAGLRGAASIVFAITATLANHSMEHDLFHIVFCVVLLSISIQGTLLPMVAERVHMINRSGNVLTPFNDYTEETDISSISIPSREGNPWARRRVCDLDLPPGTLLVFLRRAGTKLIPRGDTILQVGDSLVLSAASYTGEDDIHLKEITIDQSHKWHDKYLHDLKLPKNSLIILIRRGEQTIVPDGQTKILDGDVIVLNTL